MIPEIIEEWRPVPLDVFAAFYEVSNTGRVRSLDRLSRSKGEGCMQRFGQEMKARANYRGYLCVYMRAGKLEKNATIHRLVAGAFIKNPDNLPEVNHIDTIKGNNTATNLEWIDRLGNHSHAVKSGIKMACVRKLSDEDVASIIALAKIGIPHSGIGECFGVNQSTISRIVSGLRRANHRPTQPRSES